MPGEGDDVSGLDRRLVQRTDVQYTCACPAAPAETNDTNGQSYSSASSSAPPAEATDDCEDEGATNNYGSMADGEVTDNEPAPARRFIPLDYDISHPLAKRVRYESPPESFIPDKRSGPSGSVTDNVTPTTVTSTTTITGSCSTSGAYGSSSEVSITGGETSMSGGYPLIAAPPQTNAYGSLTTMWMGGADNPHASATAAAAGADGLSGAVSGVIDGSSL
jgi:hypothetical protein